MKVKAAYETLWPNGLSLFMPASTNHPLHEHDVRLQQLLQERLGRDVSLEEARETGQAWVRYFALLARIERRLVREGRLPDSSCGAMVGREEV